MFRENLPFVEYIRGKRTGDDGEIGDVPVGL